MGGEGSYTQLASNHDEKATVGTGGLSLERGDLVLHLLEGQALAEHAEIISQLFVNRSSDCRTYL